MKIVSGIYSIFNTETKKLYVGSTAHFNRRWAAHRHLLRKGQHHSRKLQNSWSKHGEDCFIFSVLECVPDLNELIVREQYWITVLSPHYNIAPMAGGIRGYKLSDETRARMADRMKGNTIRRGSTMSQEQKEKIANSIRGRKDSPETLAKKAAASKGKKHSEETKKRLSEIKIGQKRGPMSEETKAKLSEAKRGFRHSEASKAKMSAARIAANLLRGAA